MSGTLEIKDLRAFAAAVRAGSITGGAASLGTTQPAVSQRIQKLEQAVDADLLERGSRGIRLTSQGEALLAYADRILALHDQAHASLRARDAVRSRGHRTVALLEDLAVATLPAVLADFAMLHRDVDLEVVIESAAALSKLNKAGHLDLTLGDPSAIDVASTRWRTLLPLAWTCAPSFDLYAEPLPVVMFSLPCAWRQGVLDALAQHGRTWRVRFESTNLGAVQAAIAAGLGVGALFPVNVPAGCIQIGAGDALPAVPNVEVVIARRPGTESDAALTSLERLLRAAVGDHPLLAVDNARRQVGRDPEGDHK